MIEKAISLIKSFLPDNILMELNNISEKEDYFSTNGFSLVKVCNVDNMVKIFEKREKENIDETTRINLEKKLKFIKGMNENSSLWQGYLIKGKKKMCFYIDLSKETVLQYEDEIEG